MMSNERARTLTRRKFLNQTGLGVAALGLGCVSRSVSAGRRPNIVLITGEDMGPHLSCYGDAQVSTPHLDRLASEGMRFNRAFITQASCSPSRSSILTGLYPHQNGQLGLAHMGYQMHPGLPNMFSELKRNGYRTGIIGKLHVGPAEDFPFDWDRRDVIRETQDVAMVAEHVDGFLDQTGDAPFFLMVNYFDAHRPFDERADQYKGLPAEPVTPEAVKPWPWLGIDTPAVRDEIAAYYNCIRRLDVGIGMLLDVIEKRGKDQDTLVIFLGDHGPALSRGKTTCYEASLQVPLLMRWPGHIPPGATSDALVSSVDLFPTVIEATANTVSAPIAGRPLQPILKDKDTPWRDAVFGEFNTHAPEHFYPRRSIRGERYKLIVNLMPDRRNPVGGIGAAQLSVVEADAPVRAAYERLVQPPAIELYDLERDPFELTNLAGQSEYAAIETELKERLSAWRNATRDPYLSDKALERDWKHAQALAHKAAKH